MRARPWIVALLCQLGCNVDLALPADARVRCESNADCPGAAVCKRNLGICVGREGDDGRAPAVIAVALSPAVATIGGELGLQLTVDEPLAIEPDVLLGGNGGFVLKSRDASTNTYALTYAVRGTEVRGTQPVTARLVDEFGNETQEVVANASLDFIAPRLGSARWVLPGIKRAVKPGDLVTLIASADLDATVVSATLFSGTAAIADVTSAFLVAAAENAASLELRGEITVPSATPDGALLSIGFALADPAGNVTSPDAALGPALPVDALPPQGTLALPPTSTSATVNAVLSSVDAVSVRFIGDVQSPVGPQSPVPTQVAIVLTDGNGLKSVIAIFEDAAANIAATTPALVDVDVPPGPGAAGVACASDSECNSLTCTCANPTCSSRRCAADPTCATCKYVDNAGICQGGINAETADPQGCSAPRTCFGGACYTARGKPCELASECVTSFCECGDVACSGKICANFDCSPCSAGADCDLVRTNDSACDRGRVCRVGQCVERDPGRCSAVCSGERTCLGEAITDNGCNTAQGFAAAFTGFCPPEPPCEGSPSCTCL